MEGEAGIVAILRPERIRPHDISRFHLPTILSATLTQEITRSTRTTFVSPTSYNFSIIAMSPAPLKFNVLVDTNPNDHTLPAFMVSTTRGFLPRQDPVVSLPTEFNRLESILSRMPIKTAAGTPGLLSTCSLGETVLKDLPDLTPAIDKYHHDLPLMNALYRDYSFLASAYLLEPCHERFMKGESYGLGRQSLPSTIALPIVKVAEM